MEYYNKILCVTHEELISRRWSGDQAQHALQQCPPGQYPMRQPWRRRGNHTPCTSIPPFPQIPATFLSPSMANPEEIVEKRDTARTCPQDEKAEDFFEKHRYDKNGESWYRFRADDHGLYAERLGAEHADRRYARIRPNRNKSGVSGDYTEIMKRSEELRSSSAMKRPAVCRMAVKERSAVQPRPLRGADQREVWQQEHAEDWRGEGRHIIIAWSGAGCPNIPTTRSSRLQPHGPGKGLKPSRARRGMKAGWTAPYQTPVARCRVGRNADTPALATASTTLLFPASGDSSVWRRHETEPPVIGTKAETSNAWSHGPDEVDAYSEVLPATISASGGLHRPIPRLPHGDTAQRASPQSWYAR